MGVEIITKLPGLEKQVKLLGKTAMNNIMGKIGTRTKELNEIQIAKQTDVNGNRFPAYTPRYQAIRKSRGKDNKVDLTITGEMLNSYKILESSYDKIRLGFPTKREKNKAIGVLNNTKRPIHFVGLTKKNERKLMKYAYKLMTV